MFAEHKTKFLAVHSWDWKDQPNWTAISKFFSQKQTEKGISIIEIETGADENCIVIGEKDLTEEQAKFAYENRYEIEEGIEYENLDWTKAFEYLKEIRSKYNDIGMDGIPALTDYINPLLIRYEKNERSKYLFDSIMGLS